MSDEERIQTLAAELRVIEGYYNEVNSRETMLTNIMIESRAALDAVKTLPQTGLSEVLVPVGGGVYIHAQTPPPDSLIVSVGADVAVEKTRDSAVAFLEERIQEIGKGISDLEAQKANLGGEINSRRTEVNSLIEKLRQG